MGRHCSEEHEGKRVGVFVDGPKREDGMKLCLRTMRSSKDVLFCGLHDIAPLWKHSAGVGASRTRFDPRAFERHLVSNS